MCRQAKAQQWSLRQPILPHLYPRRHRLQAVIGQHLRLFPHLRLHLLLLRVRDLCRILPPHLHLHPHLHLLTVRRFTGRIALHVTAPLQRPLRKAEQQRRFNPQSTITPAAWDTSASSPPHKYRLLPTPLHRLRLLLLLPHLHLHPHPLLLRLLHL